MGAWGSGLPWVGVLAAATRGCPAARHEQEQARGQEDTRGRDGVEVGAEAGDCLQGAGGV